MNQYQFEQVERRMANKYGKMRKGTEDFHEGLFPLESNAFKVYRKYPNISNSTMIDAIMLVLHDIEKRLKINDNDVSKFETEETLALKEALLMAFDPFTNQDIKCILEENGQSMDIHNLEEYYKEPVMCLLRIKDSVDTWTKRYGSKGYFYFINDTLGTIIPNDDEMVFIIPIK